MSAGELYERYLTDCSAIARPRLSSKITRLVEVGQENRHPDTLGTCGARDSTVLKAIPEF